MIPWHGFAQDPAGPLNPEIGRDYRKQILERGVLEPQDAIREFPGREIGFDAMQAYYRQLAEQW